MKRYKKSAMNTQEREIFHIPAAWALFILRCTTGERADFLFGQCTDLWLTENGRSEGRRLSGNYWQPGGWGVAGF
jgi:hypothetical protein